MRRPFGSSIPARYIDLEFWHSRLLVLFQFLLSIHERPQTSGKPEKNT